MEFIQVGKVHSLDSHPIERDTAGAATLFPEKNAITETTNSEYLVAGLAVELVNAFEAYLGDQTV